MAAVVAALTLSGGPLSGRADAAATDVAVETTVTGQGTGGQLATGAMTTAAGGDVLVAVVSSDGSTTAGSQQVNSVTGGGLTFTRAVRQAGSLGDTEIWTAVAPGALSGVSFAADLAQPGYHGLITVFAVVGANTDAPVGASSGAAAVGAPSVTLVAPAAGSLVLGGGNDWDSATARTPADGQTLPTQFVDTAIGDTYWSQQAAATTAANQQVTLADAAPTGDQYNIAAVAIAPAGVTPPPPATPTTSPTTAPTAAATPTATPTPAATPPSTPAPTVPPKQPPTPTPTPTPTQSQSPTQAQTSAGWPNSTNTGPNTACSNLPMAASPNPTGQGSAYVTNITTDGAVIENINLAGSLDIWANNVTVRNMCITSKNWWGINQRSGYTGLKVLHVTIVGAPGQGLNNGGEDYGISLSGGTPGVPTSNEIGWSNISEFGEGISAGTAYVHDNYLHDEQSFIPLCGSGPCSYYNHDNALISSGSNGLDIEHNTFWNQLTPAQGASGAVGLFNDSGPITNTTVNDNLIAGGAYAIYPGGGSTSSNLKITNNKFSTKFWSGSGNYGPSATSYWNSGSGNAWSGNVWADGPNEGKPVSP